MRDQRDAARILRAYGGRGARLLERTGASPSQLPYGFTRRSGRDDDTDASEAPRSEAAATHGHHTRALTGAAARSRWARLLARIYEMFPLRCPECGAEMRILAFLTDPEPVDAILRHLDLPPHHSSGLKAGDLGVHGCVSCLLRDAPSRCRSAGSWFRPAAHSAGAHRRSVSRGTPASAGAAFHHPA